MASVAIHIAVKKAKQYKNRRDIAKDTKLEEADADYFVCFGQVKITLVTHTRVTGRPRLVDLLKNEIKGAIHRDTRYFGVTKDGQVLVLTNEELETGNVDTDFSDTHGTCAMVEGDLVVVRDGAGKYELSHKGKHREKTIHIEPIGEDKRSITEWLDARAAHA